MTKKIKKIKIDNTHRIISLDIRDMYTNIPIKDTIDIIRQQLELLHDNTIETEQLISLLTTTLDQNYFSYNNEYYKQEDGLPMGSPVSSILSEIYLQNFESQHIENIINQHNISFYGRYVDDIIIIYKQTQDNQDQNILECFNKLNKNLQFTIEKEVNKEINYLDLTLKRHNNKIEYKIFRKPTTSKLSIDYDSLHPISHKYANFRFLLNRLNQIPLSKKNYNIELNNILQIAKYNNFPITEIHKLNRNVINKIKLRKITTLTNNGGKNNIIK